jgi:adenine-specific DNA-methyltransferase
MPNKKKAKAAAADGSLENVTDYRFPDATRKNNPPAKIAAEGHIPLVPKAEYTYSPRLIPELRFDPTGRTDDLPELLAIARQRTLTEAEAWALAEALRVHEPWLEWAGKREARAFAVDPVALHIHERVSAQAILKIAAREDVNRSLFADPEQEYNEAVQFYKHDVDWSNRLILGDSLQVMSSLARREDLAGKVQMIYIDPPYGIKFKSNFQPEIGNREVKDRETDLTREPEMVRAYRDTWTLGIHSYLAYLRDRLIVARELLTDSGSIFVQIGDENVHVVRDVLDEVFGRENFILTIVIKKKSATTPTDPINDYLLWFAKDSDAAKRRVKPIYEVRRDPEDDPKFNTLVSPDGAHVRLDQLIDTDASALVATGWRWARVNYPVVSQHPSDERSKDFPFHGRLKKCGANAQWRYDVDYDMPRLAAAERLFDGGGDSLGGVVYWADWPYVAVPNIWEYHSEQQPAYVVQTNWRIVQRCMLMTTQPGELVLDPTCGSGTTPFVAEMWGRRWIGIDTSRVAVSIARQRLLTSKFEYFKLNDGEKGVADGFRYDPAPQVTLKSIAKNKNLDPLIERHGRVLDDLLASTNVELTKVTDVLRREVKAKLLAKKKQHGAKSITDADERRWNLPSKSAVWQHWEVPFDSDPEYPSDLTKAIEDYRAAWRLKMHELGECIKANAEPKELIDRLDRDRKVTRVSGPFTVEAVQPPEMSLGDAIEVTTGQFAGEPDDLRGSFVIREVQVGEAAQNVEAYLAKMVDLLKMDGVRFPDNKHLKFTRLDPIYASGGAAGIHAEGRWVNMGESDSDPEGDATVGVVFGPQYGPITAKMIEEVIRPAARRYEDLVFAGFSFDGPAQAVIDEGHPRLRMHLAHIRPDVNPGMNGLLKEQPGSQLFTVFGRPRTDLEGPDGEGMYRLKMEGVDIYDPVTNAIVDIGAAKVAAWFVDGDYDGRTFCITQAFFPDRSAWEKLSKALSGVVDPNRFEAFSGTVSLPFPAGQHKCAAVKVIDPRGNEVMRVHPLTPEGK